MIYLMIIQNHQFFSLCDIFKYKYIAMQLPARQKDIRVSLKSGRFPHHAHISLLPDL